MPLKVFEKIEVQVRVCVSACVVVRVCVCHAEMRPVCLLLS